MFGCYLLHMARLTLLRGSRNKAAVPDTLLGPWGCVSLLDSVTQPRDTAVIEFHTTDCNVAVHNTTIFPILWVFPAAQHTPTCSNPLVNIYFCEQIFLCVSGPHHSTPNKSFQPFYHPHSNHCHCITCTIESMRHPTIYVSTTQPSTPLLELTPTTHPQNHTQPNPTPGSTRNHQPRYHATIHSMSSPTTLLPTQPLGYHTNHQCVAFTVQSRQVTLLWCWGTVVGGLTGWQSWAQWSWIISSHSFRTRAEQIYWVGSVKLLTAGNIAISYGFRAIGQGPRPWHQNSDSGVERNPGSRFQHWKGSNSKFYASVRQNSGSKFKVWAFVTILRLE